VNGSLTLVNRKPLHPDDREKGFRLGTAIGFS
jgi:hypothetical protein